MSNQNIGLIDLSSENAPDYLSGNVRRIEAEKARQERKMKQLEEDVKFFEELTNNLLIPNGLATNKEKEFIFLKDHAARSKNFWKLWLENYENAKNLNGGAPLKSYMKYEFQENPAMLQGKMGSMPENLFDMCFYLEKIARFAADFQTEWKTPHFYTKKNEAGANILVEEYETERNLEARQIVYHIWDLLEDFDNTTKKILNYYQAISEKLSDQPCDNNQMGEIVKGVFNNSRLTREFEIERFELLKKYAKVIFLVKDNWERRLNRKYDGFTDADDVERTLNTLLEKRLAQIDAVLN